MCRRTIRRAGERSATCTFAALPKIDDHISYLMVRIDPDKVTPLKGGAQSRDYLSKPARKSEAARP
jgi:hypothetical protein